MSFAHRGPPNPPDARLFNPPRQEQPATSTKPASSSPPPPPPPPPDDEEHSAPGTAAEMVNGLRVVAAGAVVSWAADLWKKVEDLVTKVVDALPRQGPAPSPATVAPSVVRQLIQTPPE
jgi:hypothetical protein